MAFTLSACNNDRDEPDNPHTPIFPDVEDLKTTTLVYAVASNSLQNDLTSDSIEMVKAAAKIDISTNVVMLYRVKKTGNPTLEVLTEDGDNGYCFEILKEYDRSIYSTDPRRIRQVIDDALGWSKTTQNGIIFWSHGTGWRPENSVHPELEMPDGIVAYAYGEDKFNGVSDYCNIHDLATAIPDNKFNYIWFDCCYMGSIEVAYQLRDKASYLIGYPTEIYASGMPYNQTLPLLSREDPKLIPAADVLFEYYNKRQLACTIGVYDLRAIENLADSYRLALQGSKPATAGMINFSRLSNRLYDFGELGKAYGETIGDESFAIRFQQAIDNFVLYKATFDTDFRGRPINKENYHGISVNLFDDDGSSNSNYYKTLDWYHATNR